jgi:hypothetical protein
VANERRPDRRSAVPRPEEVGGSGPSARQAGVREVLLVAGGVVITVLAAAAATAVLPVDLRSLVTDTPLAIGVLVVVTVAVLVRVARGGGA